MRFPAPQRPQALARGEYAERARRLYQLMPAPLFVSVLYLALSVFNMLLVYEDVGPPRLVARVGLFVVINGAFFGAGFLVVQEVVRRRAGRLGLLCPSCGHYPLGISRFRYTTKAQVERILDRGRCDLCSNRLFDSAA